MSDFAGRNHGMTCREVRISLCDLITLCRGQVNRIDRKRNVTQSQKAFAKGKFTGFIRALESVLPPPIDEPYNGQSDIRPVPPAE